jgi:hypothetical protein
MKGSPHNQTHLQFAPANSNAKNCKRVCLSANAFFADLKKQNQNRANLKMK